MAIAEAPLPLSPVSTPKSAKIPKSTILRTFRILLSSRKSPRRLALPATRPLRSRGAPLERKDGGRRSEIIRADADVLAMELDPLSLPFSVFPGLRARAIASRSSESAGSGDGASSFTSRWTQGRVSVCLAGSGRDGPR